MLFAPRALSLVAVLVALFCVGFRHAGADQEFFSTERCEAPTRPLIPKRPGTSLSRPRKREKIWTSDRPLPRRNGLESSLVTVFNIHSRDAVPIFSEERLPENSLRRITACRGFGLQIDVDSRLFAAAIRAAIELEAPRITLLSGYRSPKFNDTLSKKGRAVASESRHTRGQALDIRLDGVPASKVGAWMLEHFDGGVGTYPRDDFVHIDVGPKRRWRGQ
jgi:hypothetical protein